MGKHDGSSASSIWTGATMAAQQPLYGGQHPLKVIPKQERACRKQTQPDQMYSDIVCDRSGTATFPSHELKWDRDLCDTVALVPRVGRCFLQLKPSNN